MALMKNYHLFLISFILCAIGL